MMRKGFFFTMDALIAVTIVSFAFLSVFIVKPTPPSENTGYELMHYVAEDAMQLFAMTELSQINSTVSGEILNETNITEDYIDKGLLEVVGFLWADGDTEYIKNISNDFFSGIIPSGYSYALSIKDIGGEKKVLYSSTGASPEAGNVGSLTKASRLVSGYRENSTAFGYTARAWATKITKNASKVFEFNPEGGSYDPGGKVTITKKFFLNASEIYNATLHLSIHRGTSALNSNSLKVDSSGDIISSVTWLYTQQKSEAGKTTNMDFGIIDVTSILNQTPAGWHKIEIILKSQDDFNTHLHPGTKLEVVYKTQEQKTFAGTISERKYFDNIISEQNGNKKRGAWAIMPIIIPNAANVKNVTLHLRALNVFNASGKDDIQVYFNSQSILNVTNPAPTYDNHFNLTSYANSSKNTTNVLSVYVDSFENDFWGDTDAEIYSEPQSDENRSSYVYLEYDWTSENKFKYGYIDISKIEPFGGVKENPKSYVKNFSNNDITSAYLHVAQLDSENVTITVEPLSEAKKTVFVSPRLRALPSTVYIDPYYFNVSKNNTMNVSDICTTLNCPILPQSSFEYNIYVPSQVGYGKAFNTSTEAKDDATSRLMAILSGYADADEIEADMPFVTGNIPWMYGPAIITLEVWKP